MPGHLTEMEETLPKIVEFDIIFFKGRMSGERYTIIIHTKEREHELNARGL